MFHFSYSFSLSLLSVLTETSLIEFRMFKHAEKVHVLYRCYTNNDISYIFCNALFRTWDNFTGSSTNIFSYHTVLFLENCMEFVNKIVFSIRSAPWKPLRIDKTIGILLTLFYIRTSTVGQVSSTDYRWPSIVDRQPSTIYHQLTTVDLLLTTVYRRP